MKTWVFNVHEVKVGEYIVLKFGSSPSDSDLSSYTLTFTGPFDAITFI